MKIATQKMTTRGRALALPVGLALAAGGMLRRGALAQDNGSGDVTLAEVPTTGGSRPGPVSVTASTPTAARAKGTAPIQLQSDVIGLDAPVEAGVITPDGVMKDPSGPWVATWYKDLSDLGTGSNVVMAGHVDYWGVGPSIFKDVPSLQPGDTLRVIGEDGETFDYVTEWTRLFDVANELTPEVIGTQVVGPTGKESLTLITCGGTFNGQEYLQRQVLRANATSKTTASGETVQLS